MSFLRTKWSWPLLSAVLFGLLSNFSAVRAAEKPDQGAAQSDDVDLAKVHAGGKIMFMSSGPRGGGFRAIDDDHRTTFRFSSDDPQPTLIVQLVETRPVHRVSVVLGSDAATQNARYIALRWTLSGTRREALNVAEVSAFGRGDSPVISASLAATDPPVYLVEGPPILPAISP